MDAPESVLAQAPRAVEWELQTNSGQAVTESLGMERTRQRVRDFLAPGSPMPIAAALQQTIAR